jgi:hypothetical protein
MRLLPGDRLAFLESKAFQRYPWVFDSAYPSYPSSEEQLRLSVLRVDDAGRFTKSSWDLDISAPAGASLLAAFPGEHGLVYGVVNRGRSVSVLKIAADDDTRPRFVSLSLLDARFEPGPASTQVVLHSYWGPWARAAQDAVAFVPGDAAGRDSLTFAEGWTGISQVLLEE